MDLKQRNEGPIHKSEVYIEIFNSLMQLGVWKAGGIGDLKNSEESQERKIYLWNGFCWFYFLFVPFAITQSKISSFLKIV